MQIIGSGPNFDDLEAAFYRAWTEETEKLRKVGRETKKLQVLVTPTLNPEKVPVHKLSTTQIDFVVIIISPENPLSLDKAEYEASFIENSFFARSRVGFCLWKVCYVGPSNANPVQSFHPEFQ